MDTKRDIWAVQNITSPAEAVDAFLSNLVRVRKPRNTIRRYEPDLRKFSDWAGEHTLEEIGHRQIRDGFMVDWQNDFIERHNRQPSDATLRALHVSLSSFYRYLVKERIVQWNPMDSIEAQKLSKRTIDWLKPTQDNALLDLAMAPHEEILIWFLRWTGLRLSEALALKIQDIDLAEGIIEVNDSKSESGIREVPIAPELVPRIRAWLAYLDTKGLNTPRGFFFCTTRASSSWRNPRTGIKGMSYAGAPIKPQQAERLVRRVGERVGIERLTPHKLRRTFGSYLLNKGTRLETVSNLLGHADTRITEQAYASLSKETVRKEFFEALGA